jgi:hypothetical protein
MNETSLSLVTLSLDNVTVPAEKDTPGFTDSMGRLYTPKVAHGYHTGLITFNGQGLGLSGVCIDPKARDSYGVKYPAASQHNLAIIIGTIAGVISVTVLYTFIHW